MCDTKCAGEWIFGSRLSVHVVVFVGAECCTSLRHSLHHSVVEQFCPRSSGWCGQTLAYSIDFQIKLLCSHGLGEKPCKIQFIITYIVFYAVHQYV
jgi:hypothetical protein